jgi:hypothetical protein
MYVSAKGKKCIKCRKEAKAKLNERANQKEIDKIEAEIADLLQITVKGKTVTQSENKLTAQGKKRLATLRDKLMRAKY